jgi:hypothetical protein
VRSRQSVTVVEGSAEARCREACCDHARPMNDALARYCTASEIGDIDGLMDTLGPDVEVVSPISGRMTFRGQDDVRVLLTAVYTSLTGLRWPHRIGDSDVRVVLSDARVGAVRMTDAMVLISARTVAFAGQAGTCGLGGVDALRRCPRTEGRAPPRGRPADSTGMTPQPRAPLRGTCRDPIDRDRGAGPPPCRRQCETVYASGEEAARPLYVTGHANVK